MTRAALRGGREDGCRRVFFTGVGHSSRLGDGGAGFFPPLNAGGAKVPRGSGCRRMRTGKIIVCQSTQPQTLATGYIGADAARLCRLRCEQRCCARLCWFGFPPGLADTANLAPASVWDCPCGGTSEADKQSSADVRKEAGGLEQRQAEWHAACRHGQLGGGGGGVTDTYRSAALRVHVEELGRHP